MVSNDPKAQGMFVSRWQGAMNMLKAKSAGIDYVYIRSTVGDYYTDPRYYENVQKCIDAELLQFPVHIVSGTVNHQAQIEHLLDVTQDTRGDGIVILDAELNHKDLWFRTLDMAGALAVLNQVPPVIYTAQWVETNRPGEAHKDLGAYPLSVADYRTGITDPKLPSAWSDWFDWQYEADGNGRGAEFGASSPDISLHVWEGGLAHLRLFLLLDDPIEPATVALPADLSMLDIALLLERDKRA